MPRRFNLLAVYIQEPDASTGKPGGVFLLEAYTPAQIQHGTGGGKSEEVMQTAASLRAELPGLDFVHLVELERDVVEGVFHTGLGAVVQAIGVKPVAARP